MIFPRVKSRHVFIVFWLGALSGLLAAWAEIGLMFNLLPTFQPIAVSEPTPLLLLIVVFVAPLAEEIAKPFGLYLIQGEEKPRFSLKEWAFLGAIAGFGFAVLENVLYSIYVVEYGADISFTLLLLRFMLPLHMIATAITGFGLGLWVKTRKGSYFFGCLLAAMLLHGAYNLSAVFVG